MATERIQSSSNEISSAYFQLLLSQLPVFVTPIRMDATFHRCLTDVAQ